MDDLGARAQGILDDNPDTQIEAFRRVRGETERLAAPLSPEDQCAQPMPEASPTKWHRAHTTWFFETFFLPRFDRDYRPFRADFGYLFNSYYESFGKRQPRPARGLLTRPSAAEVSEYRVHVDIAVERTLRRLKPAEREEARLVLDLGLSHEQQHQELILTDILDLFSRSPLRPAYRDDLSAPPPRPAPPLVWVERDGGIREVGHRGSGFAYDNEAPRHQVLLRDHRIASRCVTNREWQDFVADGGYRRPELWLADGWAAVQARDWEAPAYWYAGEDGRTWTMTLGGAQPLDPEAPVAHVSFYEADAYARWAGARLPTEHEWEVAAEDFPVTGNTAGSGWLRPRAAAGEGELLQLFGDVWEWTMSSYAPYPGFTPLAGAAGEYNGKFMCNQMVLRGGSCATPDGHIRHTYRNFFYPHDRWQFTGVRLANDA